MYEGHGGGGRDEAGRIRVRRPSRLSRPAAAAAAAAQQTVLLEFRRHERNDGTRPGGFGGARLGGFGGAADRRERPVGARDEERMQKGNDDERYGGKI